MGWLQTHNSGYAATAGKSRLRPNPRFARTSDTRQPLSEMPKLASESYKWSLKKMLKQEDIL